MPAASSDTVALPATASVARGATKPSRGYRARSLTAKLVLAPTVLVMLICFYGSAVWLAIFSITASWLSGA